MNSRAVLLLSIISFPLLPTSPVVSRYFPSIAVHTSSSLQQASQRPTFSITSSAAHATRSSDLIDEPREMYKFNGLMEMAGWYDLHEMTAAAKEAVPGFVSPFTRETGGTTLASRQLLFGAQSSLSLYGLNALLSVPFGRGLQVGVGVPLWHAEARQKYEFPVISVDETISVPQKEQAHRFRQALHKELGMLQKDWIVQSIGDVVGFAELLHNWGYVWLLRTVQLGGRISVSAPTSKSEDVAYPASFPLGNRGSWGISVAFMPALEIKELMWLRVPFTLAFQTTTTRAQRLPVYGEAMSFGALIGDVRTRPGVTFSFEPSLTMEHIIENLHVAIGFSFLKHYSDRVEDVRAHPAVDSYLTRSRVPTDSFGSSLPVLDQRRLVNNQIKYKADHTRWTRTYVTLGLEYELKDFFASRKYAPLLNLGLNYCIGQSHAAKMHQVTAGFLWRF